MEVSTAGALKAVLDHLKDDDAVYIWDPDNEMWTFPVVETDFNDYVMDMYGIDCVFLRPPGVPE